MALLRWIHLRKLMPIEDVIAASARRWSAAPSGPDRPHPRRRARRQPRRRRRTRAAARARPPAATRTPVTTSRQRQPPRRAARATKPPASDAAFKDAWLAEDPQGQDGVLQHRRGAGAEDRGDARSGSRLPSPRVNARCATCSNRTASGSRRWRRRSPAGGFRCERDGRGRRPSAKTAGDAVGGEEKKAALKERALADPGVQALLEVFPAEIAMSRRCELSAPE